MTQHYCCSHYVYYCSAATGNVFLVVRGCRCSVSCSDVCMRMILGLWMIHKANQSAFRSNKAEAVATVCLGVARDKINGTNVLWISCCRRSVNGVFALLGCYAAYIGSCLPTCFNLEDGTDRLSWNVDKYQHMPGNIPEEPRSHVSGIFKSRNF